jgi:hypothetical protein
MFAVLVLEIGAVFGLIVGVWFALVGWKLLALARPDPSDLAGTSGLEKSSPGGVRR